MKIAFNIDNLFPAYFRRTMTVLMILTKEIQSVCLNCENTCNRINLGRNLQT